MGKFDGFFLLTDLDSTLTDSKGEISKENAQAIRYFQNEGGMFTIATGRFPSYLDRFRDSVKLDKYIVALNGNIIYDIEKGKTIRITKMEREPFLKICDSIFKKFGNSIIQTHIHSESGSSLFDGTLDEDICKCVIITDTEKNGIRLRDYVTDNFSEKYSVARSWSTGVEIYKRGCGKGESIKYIKEKLLPSIKKVICAGDYENDITMLQYADIGYAVKNAIDSVKESADKVIDADNNQSAIAHIIYDLEKGIQK